MARPRFPAIVQSGYSCGYLRQRSPREVRPAVLGMARDVLVGGLPALLAFYIRFKVTESEAWKQHRMRLRAIVYDAAANWKLFV